MPEFGETPVQFRAPVDADADSTAAIQLAGSTMPVSESQRKVLVALCRPLKDSAYAAPATNKATIAKHCAHILTLPIF